MKRSRNRSGQVVMLVFLFMMVILAINVCYLCTTGKTMISNVNVRDFAKNRGGGQVTKVVQAARGTIYTSDNEIVASDVKKYKLRAILAKRLDAKKNPQYVVDKDQTAEELAPILGVSKATILDRLNQNTYQVEFGNYGRNLSSITKEKIMALKLPGLEFDEITSRNYRFGDFASYEVGYAAVAAETDPYNIVGQMGIEKTYNNWLKGTNGQRVYLVDSKHNTLPNGVISDKKAVGGNDVYLTINSTLQTELDSLMKDMQENTKASKACAVVMNVKTGAILAVSNYPSFDPNKRDLTNYNDTFLNEAISIIGAKNIFESEKSWISPSEESVIAANPDVILTNQAFLDDPIGSIATRKGWEGVTAIKNNQIFLLDKNTTSRPSQNVIAALKEMAKAVYPDKYE